MRWPAVTPLLLLAACSAGPDLSPSHPPPSLSVVPPSYYYRYHYSRRLHRTVREVIPSDELRAATPNETERLDRAEDALIRLRKGASR